MKATTIAITAQKGGVAKSTTSITLSAYLARQGYKVLIIDLDGQCNATGILVPRYTELKEIETVAAMLSKNFDNVGKSVVYDTNVPNLHMIPAHPRLSEAETILNTLPVREERLKRMIAPLKEVYDFIFIDCPPNINMLPINAWTASDSLIIPIQPSVFDLQGLKLMLEKVVDTKKYYNSSLHILGYLVTLFNPRTNISREIYELLVAKFKDQVFSTKIPINTAIQKAHANKMDIYGADPSSNAAQAYKSLVEKEILPKLNKTK